jgi:hypothetical protein
LSDLHSRVSPTVVVDGVGFVEFAVPSVGVYTTLVGGRLRIEVVRFHFDSNHDQYYRRSRSGINRNNNFRSRSFTRCCYSLTYIVGCRPAVEVDGVGLVWVEVPPVGRLYQFKLQFGDGVG